MNIGDKTNFEDDFIRSATVAILDTLEGEIYWNYEFSTGTKEVVVPFYYSLTGDEKFVIDTFVDDVVSDNRKTELNTDIIPRGILTWTGQDILTDQMANPNVWMRCNFEDKNEVKNILARVRPIPLSLKYELAIILNTENDCFKCAESLMNTIGIYRYMQFQYNQFNIMAVMQLPETNQFEITREKNINSNNQIKLVANFEVLTFYPAYRRPKVTGVRGIQTPDNWSDSYQYDSFKKEENPIIIPKKTKWYSNIYRSNGMQQDPRNIDNTNGNTI